MATKIIAACTLCVATISRRGGAFLFPAPLILQRHVEVAKSSFPAGLSPTPMGRSVLHASTEPEVTVFDAEGGVSWEDYKKQKPDEFKLDKTDEMTCWETDECPVEDEGKFTKAWKIRSAERDPTTETHFDSEGEWEEEVKGAWSKKWYEDVGQGGPQQEQGVPAPPQNGGYDI